MGAITLAPEGKELKRLQKIVHKTGSEVKILPDILPKNFDQVELLVLEGVEDEVDESEERPNEEILIDGEAANDKRTIKGTWVKRRGKKKKTGQEIYSAEPYLEAANNLKEFDAKKKIQEITNFEAAFPTKDNHNYDDMCRLLQSQSHILTAKENFSEVCTDSDLRNIGIAFNKASHARHDEWLKSSKNAEQHLGYRTLGDIYQVAKTGFQPAIANSSSTQAESNVNASDCDHVSPEKNTDTEESGSVSTASKSDGSSDSDDDLVLSPGQDCVGVAM